MGQRNSGIPFSEAPSGYLVVQAEGSVDECSDDPVHVAIVVDVSGYGPHVGSLYVDQYAGPDSVLQEAYELHEDWMKTHYGDHLKDLEKERLDEHVTEYLDGHRGKTRAEAIEEVEDAAYQEADEWFRSNMDGVTWKMTATEFVAALAEWPAKYRKVVEEGVTITTREECD